MRTPKQWLQKWLGIEAIAIRVVRLEIGDINPNESIPIIFDEDNLPHQLDTPNGREVESRLTEVIKKGYDKPE